MKLASLLLGVVVVAVGSTSSRADRHADEPARRKSEPPPDKLAAAAGEAFTKARQADEAGKLDQAARLYRKAMKIQPHPNTQFNLADVLRRKGDLQGALDGFKKYLEMDPGAKDRAQVEKLIRALDALPGTMVFEHEEGDGVKMFVNGNPVKPRKPFEIELPAGDYSVDLVTAITHDNRLCSVHRGVKYGCRLHPRPREDGNLVISGPPSLSRASLGRPEQPRIRIKSRFHLDPGRYQIYVAPSTTQQCKPLVIDVAPGPVLTYIYVETPEKWPGGGACVDLKLKRYVLKF